MASLYQLKPAFQRLLRPLVGGLFRIGIRPNGVTLFALGLSIGAGLILTLSAPQQVTWYLVLPLVLLARMALNAMDGMLAREYDLTSRLGAILNEVGDVVSDACLYLPFVWLPGVEPIWVVVAVFLAILTEIVGILGLTIGASRRYDGPMGKSDRAFYFGLVGLLLGLGLDLSAWMLPIWGVAIALLGITVVRRVHQALQETPSAS